MARAEELYQIQKLGDALLEYSGEPKLVRGMRTRRLYWPALDSEANAYIADAYQNIGPISFFRHRGFGLIFDDEVNTVMQLHDRKGNIQRVVRSASCESMARKVAYASTLERFIGRTARALTAQQMDYDLLLAELRHGVEVHGLDVTYEN